MDTAEEAKGAVSYGYINRSLSHTAWPSRGRFQRRLDWRHWRLFKRAELCKHKRSCRLLVALGFIVDAQKKNAAFTGKLASCTCF